VKSSIAHDTSIFEAGMTFHLVRALSLFLSVPLKNFHTGGIGTCGHQFLDGNNFSGDDILNF
jgi:hypothetical protein